MTFFRNVVWFTKGLREYTKSGYEKASVYFGQDDLKVDISQRSFMITGANSGIGKTTALTIAKLGGVVHMVCRNRERGEKALKEILEASGNTNVYLHELDISKPRAIAAFAQSFEESGKPLHVLINNAGVLLTETERQFTEDDLEVTFATNTLGTHIMTTSFIPILSKYEDPRVVIVTSGGMLVQKLDLKDLQFSRLKPFDGTMAYAQTKRQQVVLTEQYSCRWPGVHFSCMHPGWADTPGVRTSIPGFYNKMKDKLRTEEQGADTLVWLAVAKGVTQHPSGLFFQDRKVVPVHLPLAWTRSSPQEHEKLMEILDSLSAQTTK
ncbi:dehydrogenase/reductase SDR family member 12-like [Babylonia areolata]|uniref:dehydrogenase/reductase SDR family member 12-like n=1 Tax=Babylonia areolata TaxID=304850 RepID=UPI003FD061E8